MRGKKLFGIMLFLCLVLNLVAQVDQVDSTFVRYYIPTIETDLLWCQYPTWGTFAANVFEKYDGSFGMQILSTHYDFPPLETLYLQSPIATYTRGGDYLDTSFGPLNYNDLSLMNGSYSLLIKDGLGGYLALDKHEYCIHRLNNNLQFVEWVHLKIDTETLLSIKDLIIEDNELIVVSNYPDYRISKFTSDFACLWSTPLPSYQHNRLRKLNDGSYVLIGGGVLTQVMKISKTGEIIWTKQVSCGYIVDFVEINNKFYGFSYCSYGINNSELRIYDFGIDFENENPGDPILVIPTYPLLGEDLYGMGQPFSVIRTSDNCIIIAVSTPAGEIFKFDSNFNLLWSSNALPNEKIGIGFHPLIELGNGDFLYCATADEYPRRLALVRIDSNGNYTGIDDDTEQTPAKPAILAYPNPFRREIILEMKVADSSVNLLEVYNIKGQLVESKTIRGTKVTWVPQNLPSGVYILKFMSNSKQIESKMITYIK